MQRIAREFNFSESTFVLPAEAGQTRRVRIFTPSREVPFAGHPNVGTAFALATAGELGPIEGPLTVTFEEGAGIVPVTIRKRADGVLLCELEAPQRLSRGPAFTARELADAVSLDEADVVTSHHPPQVLSVGLAFLVAEVRDRAALERAKVRMEGIEALAAAGIMPDIHLYARCGGGGPGDDEFDLRTRMFAPLDGVPEDPATGSANCALAEMLAEAAEEREGELRWRIAQGVEMGRPSVLEARVVKRDGAVAATFVAGASVMVAEGFLEVD
jgi:trans-2,3-dihydro-3-hydroxyanthranilate isomerase